MKSKEQRLNNILNKYGPMVTGLSDLAADIPPPHYSIYWRINSVIFWMNLQRL